MPGPPAQVGNDGLFSYNGVRYCVPIERGLQQVRVRTRQARELLVYDLAGQLVIRHTLLPSGSPPVFSQECYEAHKMRSQAALRGLLNELRKRFNHAQTVETYIQSLLKHHPNRPERPLARVLELLQDTPAPAALAALADAAAYNLPDPATIEQLLARHLKGSGANADPPAMPQAAMPLPALDIERPLQAYAQQLPQEDAPQECRAAHEAPTNHEEGELPRSVHVFKQGDPQ